MARDWFWIPALSCRSSANVYDKLKERGFLVKAQTCGEDWFQPPIVWSVEYANIWI